MNGPSLKSGKEKRTPASIIIIVLIIIGAIQLSIFTLAPKPEKDAWGKILLPLQDAEFSRKIEVVGDTQDIASGQYIWIVTGNPDSKMCRPQKRVLRNTRFRALVEDTFSVPPVTLSIYVVDEELHQEWSRWLEMPNAESLAAPTETRRLDTIVLKY